MTLFRHMMHIYEKLFFFLFLFFTQQIKSSCLSLFVKVKFWRTCLSGTPPPQPWTPPSRCGSSCSTCWRTSGSVTWSPGQVKMESSSCWTLKRSHVCGGSARTNTTWTTTNWAEHCDTTTTRYHWWCHDILNTAGGKITSFIRKRYFLIQLSCDRKNE